MNDSGSDCGDFPDGELIAQDRQAFRHWRNERVPQLLAEARTADALAVFDRLVESPFAETRDAIERAKLLGQLNDPRAIAAYEDLVRRSKAVSAMAFGMTRLLQARENERAATLAINWLCWPRDDRLTTLAAQALVRGGEPEAALDLLSQRGRAEVTAQADLHVRLLNKFGRYQDAAALAKRSIKLGVDSHIVRLERAVALEQLGQLKEAVTAFGEVIKYAPGDVRALLRRGELSLKLGSVRSAQDDLSAASRLAPHLNTAKVAYARSLKATGDFDLAADILLQALDRQPLNNGLRKITAAGLSQASRMPEAIVVYDKLIEERSKALPADFTTGIEALWELAPAHQVSVERLDWAWKLRNADLWTNRAEWERRAKWGALADTLIYDWLECRTDRLEDTLPLIDNLGNIEPIVQPLLEQGRGLIVASAHIGPMFAGPLALELLGYDNAWLASVPSLPTIGFSKKLISTADQSEGQVARQSMRALSKQKVLTVAIDGAMSLAAPRVLFEGQSITYSSFAARLSYKQRAPSIFALPQWRNGVISFELRPLPAPVGIIDDFLNTWREAYLDYIRQALRGAPENLRLSGGLWRDVR